jgi:hypothetical protein
MTVVPSAPKDKRYDRQLRIWGAHGQQRLESSSICLLKCGPTGSETLKNLVLGGIASFTIVDGCRVETRDLGNNFLVSASSVGEPRAKVVTELLQELNESVSGRAAGWRRVDSTDGCCIRCQTARPWPLARTSSPPAAAVAWQGSHLGALLGLWLAGSYVEEVPEVLIADNPQFFAGFDLVIATQVCQLHEANG